MESMHNAVLRALHLTEQLEAKVDTEAAKQNERWEDLARRMDALERRQPPAA